MPYLLNHNTYIFLYVQGISKKVHEKVVICKVNLKNGM